MELPSTVCVWDMEDVCQVKSHCMGPLEVLLLLMIAFLHAIRSRRFIIAAAYRYQGVIWHQSDQVESCQAGSAIFKMVRHVALRFQAAEQALLDRCLGREERCGDRTAMLLEEQSATEELPSTVCVRDMVEVCQVKLECTATIRSLRETS